MFPNLGKIMFLHICKNGFKFVLESDKVIFSKKIVFVWKNYLYDGIFKLSINNKIIIYVYTIEHTSSL